MTANVTNPHYTDTPHIAGAGRGLPQLAHRGRGRQCGEPSQPEGGLPAVWRPPPLPPRPPQADQGHGGRGTGPPGVRVRRRGRSR